MLHKISIKAFILAVLYISISSTYAGIKIHFTIDINKCTFTDCDECVYECPEEAISETEIDGKVVLIIDPEKCTACEICFEICPEEAIYRDSSDIPGYIPEEDPNRNLTKEEKKKKAEEKKKKRKKEKKEKKKKK